MVLVPGELAGSLSVVQLGDEGATLGADGGYVCALGPDRAAGVD